MPNTLLSVIADNPALLQAVKEAVLSQFTFTTPISPLNTDEQLGQITRANITGMQKVEAAFREIAQFKSDNSEPISINPAR